MTGETGDLSNPVPDWPEPAPAPVVPGASTRLLQLVWWAMAAVVIADQSSKWLVQAYVPVFSSVPVISGLVDLVHVHNTGVAFGFFNDVDHPWQSAFTTGMALAALAGIFYYATHLRAHERLARIGLSLILGGAVGNLIDRARLGYVIDFVDVYWGNWHFWAFNVADSAISIGAVLIFFELLVPQRHVSNPL